MGGDGQKGTGRGEIEKLYGMKLIDKRKRGVRYCLNCSLGEQGGSYC